MHRLVIALVTLIGLTAAAFVGGYLFLFSGSTDRAAALAPAKSAFYVNLYLQPSTGQQMNLSGLIGRLPGFADDASLDEKIDQVVQNLLAGSGIDYRSDVKPWLGNQVAVAAWPGGEGLSEPVPVLIADVKDIEAARASIEEVVSAEGSSFASQTYRDVELQVSGDVTYAFVDEMLIVAAEAAAVESVIDTADGGDSLADRADFAATMDSLEADHLAAVFVDLGAVGEATGTDEQLSSMSTAGAVLVAEPDGLRLSGSAPFDSASAEPSDRAGFALGGEPSSLVDWMPESTIAEVVVFGLRQTLLDAEAAVGEVPEGEDVAGAIDTFRALAAFGLGIDLDADVLPLLDREVAVAVGGLDGELPSGQLLLRPTDAEAAADALDRLADSLSGIGATVETAMSGEVEITLVAIPETAELAYALVDGIVILGLSQADVEAAISAHESGRTLGASDRYTQTFEVAGTRGGNEAYVDVGALVELLGEAAELPDDARDILLQVGTVGFTAPSRDDQIEFHAVLTVDP